MEVLIDRNVVIIVFVVGFLYTCCSSDSSKVLEDVQVIIDAGASQVNCTEERGSEINNTNRTGSHNAFLCPSLQAALQLTGSTGRCCYHYFISFRRTASSGGFVHLITEPIVTCASVTLNSGGSESDNVTISCHTAQEILNKWTYDLKYILYFNSSLYVNFRYTIFEHCPLPIRILKAEQVEITNSAFSYFKEAVFDIHNCYNVTILESFFTSNRGTGITEKPYRGNTGSLSITYNHVETGSIPGNPIIIIKSCRFINNSATAETSFKSANQVFGKGVLTGRGGGMAVFARENVFNISVLITDCEFKENSARSYAGGAYILFNGYGHHIVLIKSCYFRSNYAGVGGGGQIFVGTQGLTESPHVFQIKNCTFHDNKATVGAALYYSINLDGGRSNRAHIADCVFTNNSLLSEHDGFGVAIAVDIGDNYEEKESFPVNTISNCLIANNTAGISSIVSIGFQTFHLFGNNNFTGNQGSSLRVKFLKKLPI
uniref:Right handed beta helix domain-containing protein n=1 Tax=Amphimedon queenslandica TaxID=400682 RepID=A0A1X7UZL8_AMPQE